MDYFKIKSILTKDSMACKVEVIKKVGEPEKDSYGNLKTPYDVKVNDKELMRFDASETQVKGMKEVGCNPFVIKRWDKGGKTGFNFLSPTDLPAQEQNCEPSISSAQIEKGVQDNKDEFSDKLSRGAAWNNAFMYILMKNDTDDKDSNGSRIADGFGLGDICETVAEAAEFIAKHQKAFVNKTQSAPETPDGKGERYEDKTTEMGTVEDLAKNKTKEEIIDDLPF